MSAGSRQQRRWRRWPTMSKTRPWRGKIYQWTLEVWVVTADPDEGTAYRRVVVVLPEAPSNVAWSVESDNLDSPERSTDAVVCSEELGYVAAPNNNYEICLLTRNETGPQEKSRLHVGNRPNGGPQLNSPALRSQTRLSHRLSCTGSELYFQDASWTRNTAKRPPMLATSQYENACHN